MSFTQEQAAAYLAGIIDGEGSIDVRGRKITITNTDIDIINASMEALRTIGIQEARIGVYKRPPFKDKYTIVISWRQEQKLVADLIPMQASIKRDKLDQMVSFYHGTNYRKVPSSERIKMIEQYKSGVLLREIAEPYGISVEAVSAWLRRHGVPRNRLANKPNLTGDYNEY